MKKLTSIFLVIILLSACGINKKPIKDFLSPSNLKSQFFSIDPARYNQIKTNHGSLIKIPAGAIHSAGSKSVQIEVKEVLSANEIIQSGLITESNGRPLQSAGMIYINATVNNENADLVKPISVSLPGDSFDPAMKIFKGEMTKDSVINWVNPVQPDTTIPNQVAEWGKALFQTKCASCHHLYYDGTGPALYGMEQRGPWRNRQNIYAFIHNAGAFMARDRYTQELKRRYGSMMTSFPDLDSSAINALLFYIKSEELRNGGSFRNPCGYDTIIAEEVPDYIRGSKADTTKYVKPENVITEVVVDTGYIYDDTTTVYDYEDTTVYDSNDATSVFVTVEDYQPDVYNFEIGSFGWYNVDAFIEGYPGLTDVKISGTLSGLKENENMTVYLFCPGKKISQYVIHQNGEEFDFDKSSAGLPFFLNERVILFAITTENGSARYGIKEFTTKKKQVVDLEIKQSSEKELLDKIKSIKLEGVSLSDVKVETIIIPIPCDQSAKPLEIDSTSK